MGLFLKIDTPDYIEAINDLIHDGWFDTSAILFDTASSVLKVPFESELWRKGELLRKRLYSWPRLGFAKVKVPGVLRIEHVWDYILEESEHIGRYDFNQIVYIPAISLIKVETNIPLRFEIKVRILSISVMIG